MKRVILSKYKLKKLSIESFRNGLRLHFDSILLFKNKSYPSAFHLSVLSLEEFGKSQWIEQYYYSNLINGPNFDNDNEKYNEEINYGTNDKSMSFIEFEQGWLNLLYQHHKKQNAFFGWGWSLDYSSTFVDYVKKRGLERKKQNSIYVGLKKIKNQIDVNSKISTPFKININDAKKNISLINDYLKELYDMDVYQDGIFDIDEKSELFTKPVVNKINSWKYRSGLRKTPLLRTILKREKN